MVVHIVTLSLFYTTILICFSSFLRVQMLSIFQVVKIIITPEIVKIPIILFVDRTMEVHNVTLASHYTMLCLRAQIVKNSYKDICE